MITEYTTRDGHTLALGRIQRQAIDDFAAENKPPDPPMREAETWTGIVQVVDYDAPEYQQAMGKYNADTHLAQLDLIAGAVEIISDASNIEEMQLLGLPQKKAALLAFLIQDRNDIRTIIEIIFYNSTVTEQGIIDAAKRFGVKWNGVAVNPFAIPHSGATSFGVYGDQLAARWGGYTWEDFCQLSGPRQSEVVTLCRLENLLQIITTPKETR